FAATSLAIVLSLLAFVLQVAGSRLPNAGGTAVGASVLSGVAGLAAPIYLFAVLPAAFASPGGVPYGTVIEGFFGGMSTSEVSLTYGGSAGWALSIVAALTLLIPALARVVARRRR
ncbi:MAG TPA: hypothetical protein VGR51_03880, partial [Thermoplasmata archaeon]|nr:hypothetical protein [Thermoplasmata archaeon]